MNAIHTDNVPPAGKKLTHVLFFLGNLVYTHTRIYIRVREKEKEDRIVMVVCSTILQSRTIAISENNDQIVIDSFRNSTIECFTKKSIIAIA